MVRKTGTWAGFLSVGFSIAPLFAANGPSLEYLEKNLNQVTYAEVVMEVGPPNRKEVLPDGSIVAMWSYDITQVDNPPGLLGGYLVRGEQYKMCRFDSQGVLRGYKWKAGILGGDSREEAPETKSKKARGMKKGNLRSGSSSR